MNVPSHVLHCVIDYEFYDKRPALDRDCKRHALLKERVDVTHRITLEDLIVGSRDARVDQE